VQAPALYVPDTKWWSHKPATVCLIGSIEHNPTVPWQTQVINALQQRSIIVFNARRVSDAASIQLPDHPEFNAQIAWELTHAIAADIVVLFFDPTSVSPDALVQLGLLADDPKMSLIVVCPPGFWRRDYVAAICTRYELPSANSIAQAVEMVEAILDSRY